MLNASLNNLSQSIRRWCGNVLLAKSSTIEFPSFSKQSVNAKTKFKHSGAFAMNHQCINKQIHRVWNFRKIIMSIQDA